jgi:hypothetical protein
MNKNTGVIIKQEKTDWTSGDTGIVYKEVCSDWTPCLPTYEAQQTNLIATQACVTFSATNCIETMLNQMLCAGTLSDDIIKKCIDFGYIVKK